MKVEFYRHSINESDIRRANVVMRSIFLTTGDAVAEFEDKFSTYLGAGITIGLTSCTAALHAGLLAWKIGPGDEVITTPMSFCATSNAILHAGATPVFVDVEEGTGNIDARLIEKKITKKTRAIIPVHLYGQMCDMRRIRSIADKHDLVVIEDAAHCVEGSRDGVKVGALAQAACFSFYATKNLTCCEGGAITTQDAQKAELLRVLRLHGIDKSAADRYTKLYKHYDMPVLGWKYNMYNIQAALLIGQLKRLESLWKKRDSICRKYEDHFGSIKGIKLMKRVPDSKHAHHLFTIRVPDDRRDEILLSLQKRGLGVAVNYRPIHLLKFYREKFGFREGDFSVAESIGRSTITLPLYPKLSDREINYVIRCVREEVKR